MTASAGDRDAAGPDGQDTAAALWPSADYHRQLRRLRGAIGETIYLAELCETDVQLGVRLTDRPYQLLGLVDFPRPDPARGLAPHLILLDDGRGVNLGRIARISRRPFRPDASDLLYLDRATHRDLLFADRRLSKAFIGERAQAALGQVLGHDAPRPTARLPARPDKSSDGDAS